MKQMAQEPESFSDEAEQELAGLMERMFAGAMRTRIDRLDERLNGLKNVLKTAQGDIEHVTFEVKQLGRQFPAVLSEQLEAKLDDKLASLQTALSGQLAPLGEVQRVLEGLQALAVAEQARNAQAAAGLECSQQQQKRWHIRWGYLAATQLLLTIGLLYLLLRR